MLPGHCVHVTTLCTSQCYIIHIQYVQRMYVLRDRYIYICVYVLRGGGRINAVSWTLLLYYTIIIMAPYTHTYIYSCNTTFTTVDDLVIRVFYHQNTNPRIMPFEKLKYSTLFHYFHWFSLIFKENIQFGLKQFFFKNKDSLKFITHYSIFILCLYCLYSYINQSLFSYTIIRSITTIPIITI